MFDGEGGEGGEGVARTDNICSGLELMTA